MLSMELCDRYRTDGFVAEGGNIHTDGEGTLMVCEEVFLNPGRNPHLTKVQMEQYLKDYTNVEKSVVGSSWHLSG